MRVVVAPDSFKGSAGAAEAAHAVRRGWLDVRPADDVVTMPLADGGEGTLDVMAGTVAGTERQWVDVDGPGGPARVPWLLCPDGTAVVELAAACGLPLHPRPDPLGAHTYAFGQLLAAAATDPRTRRITAAVGGSGSTDGGTGALHALGARFTGRSGAALPLGGGSLIDVETVDLDGMLPTPPDGVRVLVDVDAPLTGRTGAAETFGPQKGASPSEVRLLDAGLSRLVEVLGGDPDAPGCGAAGGTAYGLAAAWGAAMVPGSRELSDLAGLATQLVGADVVITGEGRLDHQSLGGKVVSQVQSEARRAEVPVWVVAGVADPATAGQFERVVELASLAGGADRSLAEPHRWLVQAGRVLAAAYPGRPRSRRG